MDQEGGHPPQGVYMQGYQPQQPGGAAVAPQVQYTTINMVSEPPRDHIIWSLCCFVYSNPFCLGLAALIFSIKARDRKLMGDLQGAQHYGSNARCLNIVSTVLVLLIIVIVILSTIITAVAASQAAGRYNPYGRGY